MTKEELKEWEKEWADFCELQASGFDRFSKLQQSGIAGCFEINGKSFIKKVLDLYKKELVERIQKIHPIAIISQGTPIEEGLVSKEKIISIISEPL